MILDDSEENLSNIIQKAYKLSRELLMNVDDIFKKLDGIMEASHGSDEYYYKYPRSVIFKITSNCNLRCKHCFFYGDSEKYDTSDEMSDKEKLALIKYLIGEINVMQFTLTGGEILTSPVFFDAINLIKKNNLPLEIITNGTLINEEIALKLSKLLDADYDKFQISLEGSTAEINDKIRGSGNFDKTIKAISFLKKYGLKVFVAMTLNKYNVSQLSDMYKLCKNLNIDRLNVANMIITQDAHKYLVAKPIDIIKNVAKLSDVYDKSVHIKLKCLKVSDFVAFDEGRKLYDDLLKDTDNDIPCDIHCTKHHEQAAIFPNGNVSLCYGSDSEEFSIGNLKSNSFEEIWNKRFSNVLFQKRLIKNSACKECKYIKFCNTGCIYMAYNLHKTINAPGIDCVYYNNFVKNKEKQDG